MTNFTKSSYTRNPNDHYPTIDTRCIKGLLDYFRPVGLACDVCSPSGSAIVDELNKLGYSAYGVEDAFKELPKETEWVITNPPL